MVSSLRIPSRRVQYNPIHPLRLTLFISSHPAGNVLRSEVGGVGRYEGAAEGKDNEIVVVLFTYAVL